MHLHLRTVKTDFLLRSGIFIFFHEAKVSVNAEPEWAEIKADTKKM